MLNSLGDGSTLSLDFTTGVLDPRLTFTRSTNATFINSQGCVEWANSNMYWNTAFEGLSGSNPSVTSSGWSYGFTGGTAVFNGDGTVTVTTTAADRRAIFRSSGFSGGGLRVVASVDVTIASGSLQASQVIVTGTPTNAQHYVNGVIWDSSHPIWNGGFLPVGTQFNIAYATDSLTSGTTSMFFGVGCSSAIAGSATFSNPRWTMWKGSATVPYYPNTSATNNSTADRYKSADYQAPRFDYDPTTTPPTPRGLLIEGSASNLFFWSESFATSGAASNWAYNSNTGAVVTSTNPANGTTSFQFAETVNSGPLQQSVTVTNAVHTFSAWFKASVYSSVTTTQVQFGLYTTAFVAGTASIISGPGSTSVAGNVVTLSGLSETQWTRVQFTTSAAISSGSVAILIYPQTTGFEVNRSFYIWGAQLEAGSGASSYIPTGASTGNRGEEQLKQTVGVSDWATSNTNRSYFIDVELLFTPFNFPEIMNVADSGGNRDQHYYYASGANTIFYLSGEYAGTADDWGVVSKTGVAPYRTKAAVSITTGTVLRSLDGANAVSVSGSPSTFQPAGLYFGPTSYTSGRVGSIILKSFKYWPTTLSGAQIKALTT